MITTKHFVWLALVVILIASAKTTVQGKFFGEGETIPSVALDIDSGTTAVVEIASKPIAAPTQVAVAFQPTVAPTEVVTSAESAPVLTGDPANGQMLFQMQGCSGCHSIDTAMTLVGPSLLTVKDVAGSRVAGLTAPEYIHQSIIDPNAFVVPNFSMGLMPQTFGTMLTEEQINDLIAYLLIR